MTALLVDLGNTRWKLSRAHDARLGRIEDGAHAGVPKLLTTCLSQYRQMVDAVWLASVAEPEITDSVVAILRNVLALPVHQVQSTDPMPDLVSGYRKPRQLGVDRLLAMVAARAQSRQAFCVIDAGTAVTIDFVDSDGQHLGGFILPGVQLSRECLLRNTAIPHDSEVEDQAVLGRDTATAVALGTRQAVAGLVERFLTGSAALFNGEEFVTFVTGGDGDAFLESLPAQCHRVDNMVLRGLAVLAAGGSR
ncbi:MAG: type III pantothenate kinase [Chromatiaceae bacterium]|jgi:type III pantothenate kinase